MEKICLNKEYVCVTGNIFTCDLNNNYIEAFLVKNGEIILTGKIEEIEKYFEEKGIKRDNIEFVKGQLDQLILPGFIDSHMHPYLGVMSSSLCCIVRDIENFGQLKSVIQEYINENPHKEWIICLGYKDEAFLDSNLKIPHYSLLDEISCDKHVVVMRYDAHAYLVNSKVINKLKLTAKTENPIGGLIEVLNGELTGVLSDSAMTIVRNHYPELTKEIKLDFFKQTLELVKSYGITSYMDAAVSDKFFNVFQEVYNNSELYSSLPRLALSISMKNNFFELENQTDSEVDDSLETKFNKIKEFFAKHKTAEWKDKDNNFNKFKINTIKLFIDGVFESGTALLHKNCMCSGNNETKRYTYTADDLKRIADYAHQEDIQLHCHCIGDLAITMVLDAIEQSNHTYNKDLSKIKHYLAHCQLVQSKDIERMKRNHVAGNFTPYWFMKEEYTKTLFDIVGEDRIKDLYPIKSFIDSGIISGFGSDFPVSTLSPLEGIEVAVTHKHLGVEQSDVFVPEQRISLIQAIKAYTIESGKILSLNKITGSLELGKRADFILLDKDIFKLEQHKIHTASVIKTFIDGSLVFENVEA